MDGGVGPARNRIILDSQKCDGLRNFTIILNNGWKFLIARADQGKFNAIQLENLGISNEISISNAQELVDKPKSAHPGDIIIITGAIVTDILNAYNLGAALENDGGLRMDGAGRLEFTVGANVNLFRHAKLDIISERLGFAGQSILLRIKTDPQTGKPYITVLNDPLFKNAHTASTKGKQNHNVTFLDGDGRDMNPIISGTWTPLFPPAIKDPVWSASISRVDVGTFGNMIGNWEILAQSAELLEIQEQTAYYTIPNLTSPTGVVDFYYPTPDIAGTYAYTIPTIPWMNTVGLPVTGRKTHISAGDWAPSRVWVGEHSGKSSHLSVIYTLYFSANSFNLNIRNADQLAFCADHRGVFGSLILSPTGGSTLLEDGGKNAVANMKRVMEAGQGDNKRYFLNFIDSNGNEMTQIIPLQYAINDPLFSGVNQVADWRNVLYLDSSRPR